MDPAVERASLDDDSLRGSALDEVFNLSWRGVEDKGGAFWSGRQVKGSMVCQAGLTRTFL